MQGDPGELAGGEPNGKCWGGYYCPAGSDQPDFIITDPGYYAYNGSSTQTECEQVPLLCCTFLRVHLPWGIMLSNIIFAELCELQGCYTL